MASSGPAYAIIGESPPTQSPYFLGALVRSKTVAQIMHEVDNQNALLEGGTEASQGQPEKTAGGLKKCLTRWDVVFYGVGSTVGAGIFVITCVLEFLVVHLVMA